MPYYVKKKNIELQGWIVIDYTRFLFVSVCQNDGQSESLTHPLNDTPTQVSVPTSDRLVIALFVPIQTCVRYEASVLAGGENPAFLQEDVNRRLNMLFLAEL